MTWDEVLERMREARQSPEVLVPEYSEDLLGRLVGFWRQSIAGSPTEIVVEPRGVFRMRWDWYDMDVVNEIAIFPDGTIEGRMWQGQKQTGRWSVKEDEPWTSGTSAAASGHERRLLQ